MEWLKYWILQIEYLLWSLRPYKEVWVLLDVNDIPVDVFTSSKKSYDEAEAGGYGAYMIIKRRLY